jgi:hypothetical protein
MTMYLLIDSCVWLDLAKDYREQPVIGALEDLIRGNDVELVVPQLVIEEVTRNKARVLGEATKSAQSQIRLVREAVVRFSDASAKDSTLAALAEVDRRMVLKGEGVQKSFDRIAKMLSSVRPVKSSAAVKARAAERALRKQAPCHLDKNSIGDAILIELYADLASKRRKVGFVTHNFKDFGPTNDDRRKPHHDLVPLFSRAGSSYFTSLVDAIGTVDPVVLADQDFEFNSSQEPRRLSEILEAENLLFKQVWYNRHQNLQTEIEDGKVEVMIPAKYSTNHYRQDQILDSVWAQAQAAARRTEAEVGFQNLRPWNDFEWGMINGKLSALRWVLGDEWDFLDT